jgi:hypothetical protein
MGKRLQGAFASALEIILAAALTAEAAIPANAEKMGRTTHIYKDARKFDPPMLRKGTPRQHDTSQSSS